MKLSSIIKNPKNYITALFIKCGSFINDNLYLRILYNLYIGKRLDLKNPKTFNEKIQWLKLNDRKPLYTRIVDKSAVKEYVANLIGREYIIPTIAEWQNIEEIDWDKLPDQFVLKTTQGGGGSDVIICKDKNNFDIDKAKNHLRNSLKHNIYLKLREWPYKDVPSKIIAEKFISNNEEPIKDYKFFCFNGEPLFLKVDFDRFVGHRANYYDLNWNLLPYGEIVCPPDFNHTEEKPQNFEKMIEIAKKLSQGFPFLRVDLYNVAGKIYFGEMTLYPASGFGRWTNEKTDEELGSKLNLN